MNEAIKVNEYKLGVILYYLAGEGVEMTLDEVRDTLERCEVIDLQGEETDYAAWLRDTPAEDIAAYLAKKEQEYDSHRQS